ncbi:hypothetical protein CH365_08660 [Leptospira neocaledonica]|uniref:Lipoprotein n=1 Tax=Leptospira neocaledonica TaxID=2023192 RepID=A0A2M9ZZZ7_9LEPT|nr:hypothetical protein CH365_08660 [Leptospira neocaledonica]
MFKRILILLVLLSAMTGCMFGTVRVTKDNFKNTHSVNLKLQLKAEESYPGTLIDSFLTKYVVEMDFTREIGKETLVPTVTRVKVHATTMNNPIERSGFLKIGEKSIPLAFGNVSSQTVTTVSTSTNSTPNYGYNPSTSASGGVKTSASTVLHLNATFLLKREDEEAILKSNGFAIRLYSGAEPITVPIVEDDLEKFKEYLTTRPED